MANINTPVLLRIEAEGQESRIVEFNEPIIKIGKLSSVNLRLDDPNVNRIHAVIEVTDGEEAQIIDMGSSKGTRVNDKRVHKSRVVSGDRIQVGDTFLTIYLGETSVAQARSGGSLGATALESSYQDDAVEESGTMVGPVPTAPPVALSGAMSISEPVEIADDTAAVTPDQAAAVQHAIALSMPAPSSVPHAMMAPVSMPFETEIPEDHGDVGTVVSRVPQPPQEPASSEPFAPAQAVAGNMMASSYPAGSIPQPSQYSAGTPDWNAPMASAQPTPMMVAQSIPVGYPPEQAAMMAPAVAYNQAPGMMQSPQFTGGFAPVSQPPMNYAPAMTPVAAQPMTGGWQAHGPMVGSPAMMSMPPAVGEPVPSSPSQSSLPSGSMVDLPAAEMADSQEALEVRVLWGDTILDHNHFYEPKRITVGESRKNTFSISSEALPPDMVSFPLIETEGDRLLINFTEKMGGELYLKDQVIPLAQIKQSAKVQQTSMGYQFALPAQSKVRLFLGDLTFEISFVPAPKRLPPAILHQIDHHLARSMGTSFLIHGILILLMLFADESPQTLGDDFFNQKNRFAQMIIRPEEPEKEKQRKKESGGAKAKGEKGKLGKKKAPDKSRKAGQKKKNPDATAPIDLKKVEKAIDLDMEKKGMLGIFKQGGGSLGSIMDAKGFGGDDANAVGGWIGSKVGASMGSGGLGSGGLGSGGGGFSGDSVGLGRVGTYGRGGGRGGRGWGRSKLRDNRRRQITVSTGPPAVFGGLDKEIIRRIINQHRSRFKYCYERELIKNPNLEGKIHVWFRIEATGRVYQSKISQTTMNNDRVEECLAQRVKLLRFPSPKGGGVVDVNYPFIFRPS